MKAAFIFFAFTVVVSIACAAQESVPRGVIWFVEYVVATDGMPKDIRIIISADPALDDKVIAAVAKNWKSPKERAGKKFRDPFPYIGQWPIGPQHGPDAILVTAAFTLDSKGAPIDIRIAKTPDPETDELVIEAVSKWRFPEDCAGQTLNQQFYFERPRKEAPNKSPQTTRTFGPRV